MKLRLVLDPGKGYRVERKWTFGWRFANWDGSFYHLEQMVHEGHEYVADEKLAHQLFQELVESFRPVVIPPKSNTPVVVREVDTGD